MRSSRFIRFGMLYGLAAVLTAITLAVPTANAQVTAEIEILSVSPRLVAASPSDIYNEVASGLNVIGRGTKLYLRAVPGEGVAGYQWAVTSRPGGSFVQPSSTSDEIITFRPDAVGRYTITLTPLDGSQQPGESFDQLIIAANYSGVGEEIFDNDPGTNPGLPGCATSFCHGSGAGNPRLQVVGDWIQSNHAQKLQNHLNGNRGSHYATSCNECHTTGYDANPAANNGGFDDAARSINYDLNQIVALVEDAVENNVDHFQDLPAELHNVASIQCESCHGPGSLHLTSLGQLDKGIAGVNLGITQCAQCHDSASGFQQKFYQWTSSSHPITAESSEGHVAETASCLKCHTGEGFVGISANGRAANDVLAEIHEHGANSITCSSCHDPHYSNQPHQLRLAGDFTLDSGHTFENPGTGGLCIRCHNARISNVMNTASNSSRGAHHGTQGDMMLGVNGVDFGLPLEALGIHRLAVGNTCVGCHMAETPEEGRGITEPPTVGEHSFAMRDTMNTDEHGDDVLNVQNTCATAACHPGLDSYDRRAFGDYDGDGDIEGIQTEVRGLLYEVLRPRILATMNGTAEESPDGKIGISGGAFAGLSLEQKWALYNYNFTVEDGSFGIHNTPFAVQLLQRSYFGVTGRSITQDYPSIALRGPVQVPENGAEDWPGYQ